MTDLTKRTAITVLAAALSLGAAQRAAYAGPIFTFDGVGISPSSPLTGANSVQTYMNGVLSTNGGGTVALSGGGLSASSTIVTNSYNGENHVFYGQNGGVASGTQWTLGTTSETFGVFSLHGGANDNFLYTFTGTSIIMQFTNVAPVGGVTFDFEIFPNADCSNVNSCGPSNVPDFTFKVNGYTPTLVADGINGHVTATNPPAGSHSPATSNETNPQLGPTFFAYSFATPMTSFTLEFDDWPATIGIDNLTFSPPRTDRSVTPEPGTMLLLGSGLAGFIARKRRKAAK